jgi:hypothetical protein
LGLPALSLAATPNTGRHSQIVMFARAPALPITGLNAALSEWRVIRPDDYRIVLLNFFDEVRNCAK